MSSDYPRLGSVDVDLDRAGDQVLGTGSAGVFRLDLSREPPTLDYNPDGSIAFSGRRR